MTKALCALLLIIGLASLIASRPVIKITREKYNKIVPIAITKLVSRMQVQLGLMLARPKELRTAEEIDEDDCFTGLTEMASSGAIVNFFLYSFKGLNDIGDYKSCSQLPNMKYILLMAKISDATPSSGNFGICGPKKCKAATYTKYLKPIMMEILKEIMEYMELPDTGYFFLNDESVKFIDVDSKNAELGTITPLGIIVFTFCGLLFLACVIFTYRDYVLSKGKFAGSTGSQIVESFSLVRNARYLFYSKNPVDKNLEVLNGVRVLSMCWVICGHTFDYFNVSPIANVFEITDVIENNYSIQIIIAGTFSIDVFFFMSGFLNALTMTAQFVKVKSNETVKAILMSYAHRYIRLLPLYLLAILITIAVVPYIFSDGPLAVFNEWQMNICKEKWWHNLLYIQNFTQIGEGCLIWSWYLANDMQFFLITPILIVFYNKYSKYTLYVIAAICVGSVGAQIYVVSHYDLSVSYFYEAKGDLFEDYYVKPYDRINAYLLGIVGAWAYYIWKDDKQKDATINVWTRKWIDNPYIKYTLIVIGIAITYVCVALQYVFDHYWRDIKVWHNVVYIIVSRPLFVIGLLMVIYPAMLGREKNLFAILGAPFWNSLAKLTYGAYLFHVIFVISEKSGEYHSTYYTIMRVFFFATHIWILSYLFSLVLSLFIELPISQLEKAFLFPRRRDAVNALGAKKEKDTEGGKRLLSESEKVETDKGKDSVPPLATAQGSDDQRLKINA